jgi:hypothetical protein
MGERVRRAYLVINSSTAPVWLAMIVAPRSRLTALLARRATAALLPALGATYTGLLAAGMAGGVRFDVSDPESVLRTLSHPPMFLAGWTHYLAFDLFVGRWIWETGLREGTGTRLPLLLTWLAGPAGLGLFLARRAASRRH